LPWHEKEIAMRRDEVFIDGKFLHANSGELIDITSPSTEKIIGAAPRGDSVDVDRAVQAARRAFDSGGWSGAPAKVRADSVRRLADELEKRSEELAQLVTAELGSPISMNRVAHVASPVSRLRAHADRGEDFDFVEVRPFAAGTGTVVHEAVGVVGAIVPFNAPVHIAVEKLGPALMAGCTVIVKTPPTNPLHSYLFAEAVQAADIPAGVLNIVPGDAQTGADLVSHPGVDKVSFTGSVAGGRAILAACAGRITRVTLELGGKSAAVVLDDALAGDVVPRLAPRSMLMSGQACILLSRVLVPRRRRDEFVEGLIDAIRAMKLGDPFDESTALGPLITSRQRDRVEGFIARGKQAGAQVVFGGGRPASPERGWYVEPTILTGVDNRSELGQSEIFGPVISVIDYDTDEEALAMANDTIYGLGGAVFSADESRARALAQRLRAGTVGVNGFATDAAFPFGGFKQSGLGREGGREGLRDFLEPKSLLVFS
jgi:aldehyde dehydrogenase (NAD+)